MRRTIASTTFRTSSLTDSDPETFWPNEPIADENHEIVVGQCSRRIVVLLFQSLYCVLWIRALCRLCCVIEVHCSARVGTGTKLRVGPFFRM
jgi:hypothetical protein